MSKPPDDYTVGFGRPPQDHRWKKGQTGNPRRRKARRPKSLKAIVDDYLDSEISISENGRRRRCLRFEAIFLQIQVKALAGHKGAMSVRTIQMRNLTCAIRFDPHGEPWVSDGMDGQVLRVDRDGNVLGAIGGGQGKAEGQFMESNYMTWDKYGNIYLGDTILPRVTELIAPRK